jgi:hypothetical protein
MGVLEVMQTDTSQSYSVKIGTSSTAYHLVVSTTGNVGIGTTNPSEKLEVAGNIKVSGGNSITVANPNTDLGLTINSNYASPNATRLLFGDGSGWKLNISRKSDSADLLTFMDNGNVGIGTTSPDAKLDV